MKDNDFARLADEALAPLVWTDQQRLDTLRLMRQPERTPVKKRLILRVLSAQLLAGLATAVALGRNSASLMDFFNDPDNYVAAVIAVPVDAGAVVTPANPRHTSRLVDATITQMYLHEDLLYIVTHLTPKEANTVLYASNVDEVIVDGSSLRYFDLYRREDMTILSCLGLTLNWDDLAGAYTPDGEITILVQRALPDTEGFGLTLLTVCEVPEELPQLRCGGYTLQAEFVLHNVRTGEHEPNVIFVDVPEMEKGRTADGG